MELGFSQSGNTGNFQINDINPKIQFNYNTFDYQTVSNILGKKSPVMQDWSRPYGPLKKTPPIVFPANMKHHVEICAHILYHSKIITHADTTYFDLDSGPGPKGYTAFLASFNNNPWYCYDILSEYMKQIHNMFAMFSSYNMTRGMVEFISSPEFDDYGSVAIVFNHLNDKYCLKKEHVSKHSAPISVWQTTGINKPILQV